jgi:3-deoxy-D-manno-octulosonate 8-phosphate phosphatase (KDO 8-P phosphatase)
MPTTKPDALERARRIRLVLFDVDGVLTDGTIWFFPTPQAGSNAPLSEEEQDRFRGAAASLPPGTAIPPGSMIEVKGFHAHDGIGIVLARKAGIKVGVITKRISLSLALRARDLRMDFVRQGVERKRLALNEILQETGCSEDEVCCMGDDIIDLPMLRHCGLAAAPANGRPEVKAAAHIITDREGGKGAARDLMEFILKAKGVWEETAAHYLADSEDEPVTTSPAHAVEQ